MMSQAKTYRESAKKIRLLLAGVSGAARADALGLADEYEAIAAELDGPQSQSGKPADFQQFALLLESRCTELKALRRVEREREAYLAKVQRDRQLLEARIEGMLEISDHFFARGSNGLATADHSQ